MVDLTGFQKSATFEFNEYSIFHLEGGRPASSGGGPPLNNGSVTVTVDTFGLLSQGKTLRVRGPSRVRVRGASRMRVRGP